MKEVCKLADIDTKVYGKRGAFRNGFLLQK